MNQKWQILENLFPFLDHADQNNNEGKPNIYSAFKYHSAS